MAQEESCARAEISAITGVEGEEGSVGPVPVVPAGGAPATVAVAVVVAVKKGVDNEVGKNRGEVVVVGEDDQVESEQVCRQVGDVEVEVEE